MPRLHPAVYGFLEPSMKVPPKRKGNGLTLCKYLCVHQPSMKVPPKRKGNFRLFGRTGVRDPAPSMKVPPKRKGN